MGAEHAVGRAPAGAPASPGAPRTPAATAWPRLDEGPSSSRSAGAAPTEHRPTDARPLESRPGAGRAPVTPTGTAPSPSGAVPVVARRRPRLPRSVLLVALGVVLVVIGALLLGTRAAAALLALELLACAVVRAVHLAPGPNALTVRSRTLDVLTLTAFAVVLAVLAAIVPGAR